MFHVGAHQHGVSIHNSINLGKKFLRTAVYMLHKKNCCDLNLGESLYIFTFFLFSDSRLYLLNGFDFIFNYFELRDTENQQ